MPSYAPPADAFYTEVRVPQYVDHLKYIGRDGFHLKRITELSRCNYIWLDFSRSIIEVYSYTERYLAKAVRMLKKRIAAFLVNSVPDVAMEIERDVEVLHVNGATNIKTIISGHPGECVIKMKRCIAEQPDTQIVGVDFSSGKLVIVLELSV